jgi:hypothetical protein
MRALAIYATKNTGTKHDSTGAFAPESLAFQKHYACYRVGFDNTLGAPKRTAFVEETLRAHRDLEMVAFFCHGLRRSLQTGHDMATVGRLASAIAEASGPRVIVALYACSTGAATLVGHQGQETRENGFAAALRNALHALGKTGHVDAHTNAAHTTRNPYVRRFMMGETGADFIVEPSSPSWKRWRTELTRDLRFRFPALTVEQVRAEVR